jgi:hypothetical protein
MILQQEADRKKREKETAVAEEKRMAKIQKLKKTKGRPEYDDIEMELLRKYKG